MSLSVSDSATSNALSDYNNHTTCTSRSPPASTAQLNSKITMTMSQPSRRAKDVHVRNDSLTPSNRENNAKRLNNSNGRTRLRRSPLSPRIPRINSEGHPVMKHLPRGVQLISLFLTSTLIVSVACTFTFHQKYIAFWFRGKGSVGIETTIQSHTLRRASISSSSVTKDEYHSRPLKHPRIAYLENIWSFEEWSKQRKIRLFTLEMNQSTHSENEWTPPGNSMGGKCLPKAEWQTKSNPNCNSIHEIDFSSALAKEIIDSTVVNISSFVTESEDLSLLGEGWFRSTWRLDRHINTPVTIHDAKHSTETHGMESVVLKTLRIEREFLSEYYELHRRDAVAMERLTASPFVVDVFGFCGQSAVNEMADFPAPGLQTLEAFNHRIRGSNSPKTAEIKLRLAASIALGVADIHAAGENMDNVPVGKEDVYMVHYDLNPRNIALFSGGKPKLNDFNIAEFLRYDTETNKTCGFPSRLHEPWWRAPEEMNVNATKEGVMIDEKVDIYALGNILFHTLTTHSPWGKMKKERIPEVRPKVAKGIHPAIPKVYLKDKNPHVVAVVKAIKMCWEKDPAKRASAEQVADLLYNALLTVKESDIMDVVEKKSDTKEDDIEDIGVIDRK